MIWGCMLCNLPYATVPDVQDIYIYIYMYIYMYIYVCIDMYTCLFLGLHGGCYVDGA